MFLALTVDLGLYRSLFTAGIWCISKGSSERFSLVASVMRLRAHAPGWDAGLKGTRAAGSAASVCFR